MSKRKKNKRETQHPTIFVLDGEIKWYEDGSMLELYTQITPEEWQHIVEETIKYKVFLTVLKEVAFPILKETWTKEDDWWRLQLDVAIDRMKNIDPMFVITINQDKLKESYSAQSKLNAEEMVKTIKLLRNMPTPNFSNNTISDL